MYFSHFFVVIWHCHSNPILTYSFTRFFDQYCEFKIYSPPSTLILYFSSNSEDNGGRILRIKWRHVILSDVFSSKCTIYIRIKIQGVLRITHSFTLWCVPLGSGLFVRPRVNIVFSGSYLFYIFIYIFLFI